MSLYQPLRAFPTRHVAGLVARISCNTNTSLTIQLHLFAKHGQRVYGRSYIIRGTGSEGKLLNVQSPQTRRRCVPPFPHTAPRIVAFELGTESAKNTRVYDDIYLGKE